jgi:GT2 family glycosyltransferase
VESADVTVVVVTRNRCQRLDSCLSAVATLPDRPDVIVVDNASTDGTSTMVGQRFPEVRLIRLDRNHGARARNIGAAHARTALVAFTDDDSGWLAGSLGRAEAIFRRSPRLGLIAARMLVGPDRRLDPVSAFMQTAPLGVAEDLPGPTVLGFLACAAIVRRSAFLAVGGFDPVTFFMGEETRVAYDLARAGWGLAYCDDVVAWHDPTPPESPARQRLAERNRALTAWMRRPLPVALEDTVHLLRQARRCPYARQAVQQLVARLPAALARRRRPDPCLERQLRALEQRQSDFLTVV